MYELGGYDPDNDGVSDGILASYGASPFLKVLCSYTFLLYIIFYIILYYILYYFILYFKSRVGLIVTNIF
jgi:hypothetical protein